MRAKFVNENENFYDGYFYNSDLKPGKIYRYKVMVEQGPFKGEYLITDEKFLGSKGDNILQFETIKIHTPQVADYLGVNVGDISSTGPGTINRDYSEIK